MHDPMTLAFEIKSPIKHKTKFSPKGYRNTLVSIWHVDPDLKGDDDSCGWFKRSRHGDKEVLERIVKRYEFDWDRSYTSESGQKYNSGLFDDTPFAMPVYSVQGVVLNLFFLAAMEHFDEGKERWGYSRRKATKFCQKNLFEILLFAENPIDSMHDTIMHKFGYDHRPNEREERIHSMAECIYGWILREERPWWRHPRWHMHHWKVQVAFVLNFKRWAFSRCQKCGKGFKWNYCPVSTCWDGTGPLWFRSEKYIEHSDCKHPNSECCGVTAKEENATQ